MAINISTNFIAKISTIIDQQHSNQMSEQEKTTAKVFITKIYTEAQTLRALFTGLDQLKSLNAQPLHLPQEATKEIAEFIKQIESQAASTAGPFKGLPRELCLGILKHMDATDLSRFGQTCSYFDRLCQTPQLWENLSRKAFPLANNPSKMTYQNLDAASKLKLQKGFSYRTSTTTAFSCVMETPTGELIMSLWDGTIRVCNDKLDKICDLNGHEACVSCFLLMNEQLISGSDDSKIKIWDLSSHKCINTLDGHEASIEKLIFSSTTQRLVSCSKDQIVKIWSLNNNTKTALLTFKADGMSAMVLNPEQTGLIIAFEDGSIKIWDLITLNITANWEGHSGRIDAVILSPKKELVTCSLDRTLKIWNLKTQGQECLHTLTLPNYCSSEHCPLVFLPNGKLANISKENIQIWDLTNEHCDTLIGHSDRILHLILSPIGLISISQDRTLKIWDPQIKKYELFSSTLDFAPSLCRSPIFTSSGMFLLSHSKITSVWHLGKDF
jgi:WD40 repeat protein